MTFSQWLKPTYTKVLAFVDLLLYFRACFCNFPQKPYTVSISFL